MKVTLQDAKDRLALLLFNLNEDQEFHLSDQDCMALELIWQFLELVQHQNEVDFTQSTIEAPA